MARHIKQTKPELTEFTPRQRVVDMSESPAYPTFAKAHKALDIPGGFQRFVVAREDGKFVPVVMLLPTEFTPDIIRHVERAGCHVMVGVAAASVEVGR